MLTVHPVCDVDSKIEFLNQHTAEPMSWIVSDLQSKRELQQRMLSRWNFLEETSLLRASELWKILFTRLEPSFRCISTELTRVMLAEWLKSLELSWLRSNESEKTLLVYLEQFLPILNHPNGEELLASWLQEHPESQIRWLSWYELSKRAWEFFFEKRLLPATMVSAALLNYPLRGIAWDRPFVFDLGFAISTVEVELIRELSQTHHVIALRPSGGELRGSAQLHYEDLSR